jgi:hypothetical protein
MTFLGKLSAQSISLRTQRELNASVPTTAMTWVAFSIPALIVGIAIAAHSKK